MKRAYLILPTLFILMFSSHLFAEDTATSATMGKIKITVAGVNSYKEYRTLLDDIKKIQGVTVLVPSAEKAGKLTAEGSFSGEPDMLKNDVQALTLDRYKFECKESRGNLTININKL